MIKGKQGFASMDEDDVREIQSMGGKTLAAKTNMAELGRRGGLKSGAVRRQKKLERLQK